MNAPTRSPLLAAVCLLPGLLGTACDSVFDINGRSLDNNPPVEQDAGAPATDAAPEMDAQPAMDAEPPRTCRAVTVDPSLDYEAMCSHYCDTLDETTRYLSLSRNESPAPAGTVSQMCYQLRCVPKCVDQALCFAQCDAVATQYAAVCANSVVTPDSVCPVSLDDHDTACRAGCSPPVVHPPVP
ncbi:MAG TPA: hypothetical protein VN903_11440 [Polyangia bacterium]|jgi:hypothetical protein|nr:hypothetical protein [Polyangia bacterium]